MVLPHHPPAVPSLPKGDSIPKRTKRCGQCSVPSAWDSWAVHDHHSSRLTLSSWTAVMQRVLSSASCLSLCIYPVLLYPHIVTHMALWSTAQRWSCTPRSSSTSLSQESPSQHFLAEICLEQKPVPAATSDFRLPQADLQAFLGEAVPQHSFRVIVKLNQLCL